MYKIRAPGNSADQPGPIPFSVSWSDQALEGAIAMNPGLGNPEGMTLEVHLAGKRLGSAALTDEGAFRLALRLVGTIMNGRRIARDRMTAPRLSIYRRLEVDGMSPPAREVRQ